MSRLSHKSLMLRSCYLYYIEGVDIQEIARRLDISRFKVSRYISEARDKGLITLQINDPDIGFESQAIRLEQVFNLKRVIIAPLPAGAGLEETRQVIGKAGAVLFQDLEEDTHLAITWGKTMSYLVEDIPAQSGRIKNIVELAGSIGTITESISAHTVSLTAAEKLKAICVQIPAPIIVDQPETALLLMKQNVIKQAINMAANCQVAICGVGPIQPFNSTLHRAGYLAETEMAYLEAQGALGSLFGRFINHNGAECETEFKDKVIALSLEQYKSIPERIIVAGGPNKIDILYALVNNGVITGLVTDSETAAALLQRKASELPANKHDR
ncbi:MAG: hypothetical protein LWX83_01580 [Anaerolineae bacterium]|nr:hypothetical protein [Anaerolineae bacterium]